MTYDAANTPAAPDASSRPTGVVLAAITLGFATLGLLFLAGIFVLAAVAMHSSPEQLAAAQANAQAAAQAHGTPATPPPPIGVLMVAEGVMALISLALAGWGAATVVGLFRLKGWARISIMIQGGFLAAASAMWAVGSAVAPAMMKATPMPPTVNPAQLKLVFAAFALLGLLGVLLGAWWIVYFALSGTRKAFEPAVAAAQPMGNLTPWPVPPQRAPRPTGPELITDFTVAQPLPPEERTDVPQPPPSDAP